MAGVDHCNYSAVCSVCGVIADSCGYPLAEIQADLHNVDHKVKHKVAVKRGGRTA